MPKDFTRHALKGYKGVFYILGTSPATGKSERIYYIRYRDQSGKLVEEKAGRQTVDNMTVARAVAIRADKMRGKKLPNRDLRVAEKAARKAEEGRWTFDRLWEEWKAANPHKKGKVNDDNRYQTHLKGPFGDKEPRELAPLDVNRLRVRMMKASAHPAGRKFDPNAKRWADYSEAKRKELAAKAAERAAKMEKKPYAVGTVKSVLGLLTRIANFGVKRQLCDGLRFKVERPKGAKEKTEDMSGEQMARYIQVCREWPDVQAGNFQLLMLNTGMRRGEVRNLKWTDIDAKRGFILIRDPKGGEDQRIPLNDAAAELLRAHPRDEKNEYVFQGERSGGPRAIRHIAESSRAIRNAAGLPKDFRPNHGLRHTFASHLASSGQVDLYTLQKMMTHKSPTMTQRYAHLQDDALRRGADVMSRIVQEAEGKNVGEKGS